MVIDFELQFKQLLIQQDEPTFNDFYQDTVDIFYRYLKSNYFLSPEETEDVISDFYVKCRNGLPKYDLNQNFSGYIWMIFKNNLKDFFKKREDTPFTLLSNETEKADFSDGVADPNDFTELLESDFSFEYIQQAMKELDTISQEVIFLKFIEEKDYEEIADILHLSQDAVRQKCSRALKQLRSLLQDE